MAKLIVWTYIYNAFRMGGNTGQPEGFELETKDLQEHDLGAGYRGYAVHAPDGSTVIVESTSGGIVGHDLDSVIKDILTGDRDMMAQQVADAQKASPMVRPETEFWNLYLRGGKSQ